MDIIFKGRRTDVQERFRSYASAKLNRITKLAHRAIRVDVEVSAERNPRQSGRRERVELTILSRGPAIRAEAAADDRFAALDRALAKLEERLRRSGDRRKSARHGALSAGRVPGPRSAAAADLAATRPVPYAEASPWDLGAPVPSGNGTEPGQPARRAEPASDDDLAEEAAGVVPIQMEGDGPVVVREKFHAAAPVSVDQALLEMELVGHDFYLFRDEQCGLPSVVYRRHGYQYGLIRLVEQTQPGVAASGGREV
ncbi:MAG TPA: ribosome-associated translation inhibitor RaiA [Streptosporangiaceae bacterium]|nr:ribosome-associated translation inhibitor RaiA [Streptosporangiaceae bacterium]